MNTYKLKTLPIIHRIKIAQSRKKMLDKGYCMSRREEILQWWEKQKTSDQLIKMPGLPRRGDELIEVYTVDEERDYRNLNIVALCVRENRLDIFKILLQRGLSSLISHFGSRSDSFGYNHAFLNPQYISQIIDSVHTYSAWHMIFKYDNVEAMKIALKFDKSNLLDAQNKFIDQWLFLCFSYNSYKCLDYITSIEKYKNIWIDYEPASTKINHINQHPLKVMFLACNSNVAKLVPILEKNGFDYNRQINKNNGEIGKQLLYDCVKFDKYEKLEYLLSRGLSPNTLIEDKHKLWTRAYRFGITKSYESHEKVILEAEQETEDFEKVEDIIGMSILKGNRKIFDMGIKYNYNWFFIKNNWDRIERKYKNLKLVGAINMLDEDIFEYAQEIYKANFSKNDLIAHITTQKEDDEGSGRGKRKI